MENWNTAVSALFLLALQLVGINLSGSLVLRFYGLSSTLQRYEPGKKWMFFVSLAATIVLMAGLLIWQFSSPLQFQRSSIEARTAQQIRQVIEENPLVEVVEISVRFPEADPQGSRNLLVTGYIRRAEHIEAPAEPLAAYLQEKITERLKETDPNIIPYIELNVVKTIETAK